MHSAMAISSGSFAVQAVSNIIVIVNGVATQGTLTTDASRMQCDPEQSILPVTIFQHPGRCHRN